MIRALLVSIFFLALGASVHAAPAVVHYSLNCASATGTLPVAPTNGNVVVVVISGASLGGTVTDSNAVALTQEATNGGNSGSQIWDYVVHGSPTAVFSWSGTAQTTCPAEISGVSLPPSTQALNGVTNVNGAVGDLDFCAGSATIGSSAWQLFTTGALTSTFMNNGFSTDSFVSFFATSDSAGQQQCFDSATTYSSALAVYHPPGGASGFIGSSGLYLFR